MLVYIDTFVEMSNQNDVWQARLVWAQSMQMQSCLHSFAVWNFCNGFWSFELKTSFWLHLDPSMLINFTLILMNYLHLLSPMRSISSIYLWKCWLKTASQFVVDRLRYWSYHTSYINIIINLSWLIFNVLSLCCFFSSFHFVCFAGFVWI